MARFLLQQAHCLSGQFCHVVLCPLEVELGPQSLPWLLLLLILRNSVIVPGLLLKRIWAGRAGGTVPISVTGKGWSGAQPALLRGQSQVGSGSPAMPARRGREHSATEGADTLSGLGVFLECLPG